MHTKPILVLALIPLFLLSIIAQDSLSGGEGPDEPSGAKYRMSPPNAARKPPLSILNRKGSVPYDFARPAASFEMPGRLQEISGIDVADARRLAAIEDERGRLYFLDIETGEVEAEHTFGKKGDYEDLAFVSDRVYVLRSDGVLFEIEDWDEKEPEKIKRHKTDVPRGCDAEGLALMPDRKRLLIACKERAGKGLKNQRAIYAYDVHEETLLKPPAYVISMDELNPFLSMPSADDEPALRFEHGARRFKPSSIRFHPLTGELYVLSSVTKAIAVLSPDGPLLTVYPLSGRLLPQPEGLAFLPGGDLLISSEGRRSAGSLHRFTYRPH